MPEKQTVERAHRDAREGKSPSTQAEGKSPGTQAGEFVREEMHHVREGKHGAASTKQAIAIGLSKARRSGVKLRAPRKGKASSRTRKRASRDYTKGQRRSASRPSATRSRATRRALKKQAHRAASPGALASQARAAARGRSAAERHRSAVKASRTRKKNH